jgi:hypothetical protein
VISGRAWQVGAEDLVGFSTWQAPKTGDVFVVAADDLPYGLSNGRTFDYRGSIRLLRGSLLYSR